MELEPTWRITNLVNTNFKAPYGQMQILAPAAFTSTTTRSPFLYPEFYITTATIDVHHILETLIMPWALFKCPTQALSHVQQLERKSVAAHAQPPPADILHSI